MIRGITRISGWLWMLARVLEWGFCGLSADWTRPRRRERQPSPRRLPRFRPLRSFRSFRSTCIPVNVDSGHAHSGQRARLVMLLRGARSLLHTSMRRGLFPRQGASTVWTVEAGTPDSRRSTPSPTTSSTAMHDVRTSVTSDPFGRKSGREVQLRFSSSADTT